MTKTRPQPIEAPAPNIGLESIHAAPGHLIRRLQQIAVGIFLDEMKPFDVTPMQYAALAAISDRPGIDQRTLSKLVAIDRSTVGTMLRVMERKALITRRTPAANQRIREIFVTPHGAVILRRSRAALTRSQARILDPLTGAERARFQEQLAKLVDYNNARSRAPLLFVREKASPGSRRRRPRAIDES
jgi:MarR family transcriptional regulator, lower aerobic nicotinate degradation pathway regulator